MIIKKIVMLDTLLLLIHLIFLFALRFYCCNYNVICIPLPTEIHLYLYEYKKIHTAPLQEEQIPKYFKYKDVSSTDT